MNAAVDDLSPGMEVSGTARTVAIIGALACAGFTATFDINAVAFSLPTLVVELGVSSGTVSWLIIAYAMTAGGLFIIAGRTADAVGCRRVFHAGCVCLVVGAILAALSVGLAMLVAARVVQGAGMALVLSSSPAVLAATFPGARQDRAIAVYVSAVTTGIIAGPVAGGLVAAALDWRWVFGLIALLSLALTGLAFASLPTRPPLPSAEGAHPSGGSARPASTVGGALRTFDYLGAVLLFGCVGAVVVALDAGPSRGWSASLPLGAVVVATACLAAFILRERAAADTLVDLRLLRIRRFVLSSLLCGTVMMVYYSVVILIPYYLLVVRGYATWVGGLFLAGGVLPVIAIGPFALRLRAADGGYRTRLYAAVAMLAGVLALLLLDADADRWVTILGIALVVAGVALMVPPLQAAALRATPLSERGSAAGVLMTMRNLGCIVGAAAAQSVMGEAVAIEAARAGTAAVSDAAVRATVLAGIRHALWFSVAGAMMTLLAALLLREPRRRARREPASDLPGERESVRDVLRRAMVVSAFAPAPAPLVPLGTAVEAGSAASESVQTPEEPKPRSARAESDSS